MDDLSPEDIEIDFDKIDTSTLFDDDFEEKEVAVKILPQSKKPSQISRKIEDTGEPPPTDLRKGDVFGVRDSVDGKVETRGGVAIRTKPSVVKKKGSSLVLLIALAIIFLIIISLWLTGFLDF
jgi:hypothetical protein